MAMLAGLLSIALAAAPILLPGSGFADGRPPAGELDPAGQFVGVHVTVDRAGLPHDCVVLDSTKVEALDAHICELSTRMRFTPARGVDGRPVEAGYRGYVGVRRVSGSVPQAATAGVIPGRAVLLVATDPDGRIDTCLVEASSDLTPTTLGCDLVRTLPLAAVLGRPMTTFKAVRLATHVQLGTTFAPVRQTKGKVTVVVLAADMTIDRDGRVERCAAVVAPGDAGPSPVDPCSFVAKQPFPPSADDHRRATVSVFVVGVGRDDRAPTPAAP